MFPRILSQADLSVQVALLKQSMRILTFTELIRRLSVSSDDASSYPAS